MKIIPVGGCGEFGLNLTIFQAGNQAIIVDCGVKFTDCEAPGTDGFLPDLKAVMNQLGGVKILAYVITHGHEDHIGSLPHALRQIEAPVFCTDWTRLLLNTKFHFWSMDVPVINVVHHRESKNIGPFKVTWALINHSIPMSSTLLIEAEGKKVFHSGDFKLDFDPVENDPPVDEEYYKKMGEKKVDLMICDSTNAGSEGFTPGEKEVLDTLIGVLNESRNKKSKVIITTFASNAWRIQSFLKAAQHAGRRVYIEGGGIVRTLESMKAYSWDKYLGCVEDNLKTFAKLPKGKQLILASGSQGEPRAAMAKLIFDTKHPLSVEGGDVVIFSSRLIPGNEKKVYGQFSEARKRGARVITQKDYPLIHVSGHAHTKDIETLVSWVKPKDFLPVHGTYIQLADNKEKHEKLFGKTALGENFFAFTWDKKEVFVKKETKLQAERLYLDAFSKLVMDKAKVMERRNVAENGLVIVSAYLEVEGAYCLQKPKVLTVGLPVPNEYKNAEKWAHRCSIEAEKMLEKMLEEKVKFSNQESYFTKRYQGFLYDHFKRKIPIQVMLHTMG